MLNHAAAPITSWTDADLLEQDMLLFLSSAACYTPGAIACSTSLWRHSSFRARAMACTAWNRAIQPHLLFAPTGYSFQRNKKLYSNIFTLHGPLATPRVKKPLERTGAAKVEIQPAKQVVEIDPAEQIFLAESLHSRETADIIFSALLRVGQDSIRLGNFFKALLGSWFLVTI